MGSEGKNQSSSRRSRGRDRGNDRGRGSDSRGRGRGANQVEASIDDDGFTMVPESRSRSRSTQRSQSVTRSGALLSEPRGSTQRYRPTGAEHEQYIRGIWFQWNHPVEPPLLARTIKAIEEYLDNPRGDDPNAVMTRARYQPTQAIVAAEGAHKSSQYTEKRGYIPGADQRMHITVTFMNDTDAAKPKPVGYIIHIETDLQHNYLPNVRSSGWNTVKHLTETCNIVHLNNRALGRRPPLQAYYPINSAAESSSSTQAYVEAPIPEIAWNKKLDMTSTSTTPARNRSPSRERSREPPTRDPSPAATFETREDDNNVTYRVYTENGYTCRLNNDGRLEAYTPVFEPYLAPAAGKQVRGRDRRGRDNRGRGS